MNRWLKHAKTGLFAVVACATFCVGAFALISCGGEGGPVGSGNGGTDTGTVVAQFRALLTTAQKTATYVGAAKCGQCHDGAQHDNIYSDWSATAHKDNKVECEQCHGPGSAHAAAPATTNILTGGKVTNPVVCGQCHGPIYTQYAETKHHDIIAAEVQNAVTSPASSGKGSRCFMCHGGYSRMATYEKGIELNDLTDAQIVAVAQENLTNAPFTASCVTCHNPHKKTGNLDVDGAEVQLRHPVSNSSTAEIGPGTAATSFTKFDHICAECHNGRGANNTDAALNSGTSRPNMHDSPQFNMLMGVSGIEGSGAVNKTTAHASATGQCAHCHMPNGDHSMTIKTDVSCQPCHSSADAANRTAAAKNEITAGLYALRTRMQTWSNTAFPGKFQQWEYTSNIVSPETAPNQASVPIQVKRARHNYYFIIRDASTGIHNMNYARLLLEVANQNLDAISVPRSRAASGLSVRQMAQVLESDRLKAKLNARHEDF